VQAAGMRVTTSTALDEAAPRSCATTIRGARWWVKTLQTRHAQHSAICLSCWACPRQSARAITGCHPRV